jgi:hypothetical protein
MHTSCTIASTRTRIEQRACLGSCCAYALHSVLGVLRGSIRKSGVSFETRRYVGLVKYADEIKRKGAQVLGGGNDIVAVRGRSRRSSHRECGIGPLSMLEAMKLRWKTVEKCPPMRVSTCLYSSSPPPAMRFSGRLYLWAVVAAMLHSRANSGRDATPLCTTRRSGIGTSVLSVNIESIEPTDCRPRKGTLTDARNA